MKNSLRRGIRNEKEKMEQSFSCTFNDGDEYITSVRMWQQKCGKRRCRNNHGVLILMTAIGQSQSESEADVYYLWKTMN